MKNRKAGALKTFAAALLAAAIAKAFVLDVVVVSGRSMLPALRDGQLVLVNKLAWGLRLPLTSRYLIRWSSPKAGDIAVFLRDGAYAVKRCVATEGMALVVDDKGGYSLLAGNTRLPLIESQYKRMINEPEVVPSGAVFVAGDNLDASFDSRDYGPVSADSFCGRVVGVSRQLPASSSQPPALGSGKELVHGRKNGKSANSFQLPAASSRVGQGVSARAQERQISRQLPASSFQL